jgi:hypothetical protein
LGADALLEDELVALEFDDDDDFFGISKSPETMSGWRKK